MMAQKPTIGNFADNRGVAKEINVLHFNACLKNIS